jgi:hypothetical protein
MDASEYKDYVLILLFVKYVSDKYAGNPNALIDVPPPQGDKPGGSFADMVAAKGDKEIGDKVNKIIGRLADANDSLKGAINVADFNDEEKLGKGKEMVDRLSKLVSNGLGALRPGNGQRHQHPAYFDKMSQLLDALIAQRRKAVISYAEYLKQIAQLAKDVTQPGGPAAYPAELQTAAQRALFNNLDRNAVLALQVDAAIRGSLQNDWKTNAMKTKRVRLAIRAALAQAMRTRRPVHSRA